jgi:Na+-transporting methylmalonyl-CoA/oxaloacetate decarboxylase gamma subunit
MSTLLALIASFWGRIAGAAATFGLPAVLAFLTPLAPVISGVGQFIGAAVTAIGEILAALSKSAEGRVALCLLVALFGFLYLRFHYIEEGKAIEKAKIAATHKPCHPSRIERRSR